MPRTTPGSTQAIHNPVVRKKTIESADTPPMQNEPRVLQSTGDAKDALKSDTVLLPATERLGDPEKEAMLKFLAEPIDVRIATSSDKQAEQVFEVGVNGRIYFFRRGEVKTVPRFVVDRLARTKITGYRQEEVVNKEGVRQIVNIPNTSLRYDFSVVRDDSPYGEAWLKSVLAERG